MYISDNFRMAVYGLGLLTVMVFSGVDLLGTIPIIGTIGSTILDLFGNSIIVIFGFILLITSRYISFKKVIAFGVLLFVVCGEFAVGVSSTAIPVLSLGGIQGGGLITFLIQAGALSLIYKG